MLYTKKGDSGTTKLFSSTSDERLLKSDTIFAALGALDEVNTHIGYVKTLSRVSKDSVVIDTQKVSYEEILDTVLQHLFCIQAELAGSPATLTQSHLLYVEHVIAEVETVLPPIKTFIIPGGGPTAAYLDVCRTVARRAERAITQVVSEKKYTITQNTIAYMNRLSSILYALARFANYQEGYVEKKPVYR